MQAEQRSSFPEVQVPGPGQVEQEDIPLNYMVLSDSLKMVGVELKATWSQTRKVNGARISRIREVYGHFLSTMVIEHL